MYSAKSKTEPAVGSTSSLLVDASVHLAKLRETRALTRTPGRSSRAGHSTGLHVWFAPKVSPRRSCPPERLEGFPQGSGISPTLPIPPRHLPAWIRGPNPNQLASILSDPRSWTTELGQADKSPSSDVASCFGHVPISFTVRDAISKPSLEGWLPEPTRVLGPDWADGRDISTCMPTRRRLARRTEEQGPLGELMLDSGLPQRTGG